MTQRELQIKVERLDIVIGNLNRMFQELVTLAASDGDWDYDSEADTWTKVGKSKNILSDDIEFWEN